MATPDTSKLKIVLISHGMKKIQWKGDLLIPKADFYIDCRGIQEKGLKGTSGKDQEFQSGVESNSSASLNGMEMMILDGLKQLPSRRVGALDPYKEPYVVCFMCAWGIHRSVATKNIMWRRLTEKGYKVEVKE